MTNIFTYALLLKNLQLRESVDTLTKIARGLASGDIELCDGGLIMSQDYYNNVYKQIK